MISAPLYCRSSVSASLSRPRADDATLQGLLGTPMLRLLWLLKGMVVPMAWSCCFRLGHATKTSSPTRIDDARYTAGTTLPNGTTRCAARRHIYQSGRFPTALGRVTSWHKLSRERYYHSYCE